MNHPPNAARPAISPCAKQPQRRSSHLRACAAAVALLTVGYGQVQAQGQLETQRLSGAVVLNAPAPRAAEPSLTYTVQAKDTLISLSRTVFNGPEAWAGVARYNGLKNPNLIYPGQKLEVPLRYLAAKASGGRVLSMSGEVRVDGQPLLTGDVVRSGQQFKTGPDGSAMLELGDGSRIKLLPNSLAEVVTNSDYAMRDASASGSTNWFSGVMRLTSGALEAFAAKGAKRATNLRIETPTLVLGVRGTEFRVAFDDPATLSARAEVLEGLVRADGSAPAAGANLPMGTGAVVKPRDTDIKVVNLLPAPDAASIASEVFQPQARLSLPNMAGAASLRVLIASDEKFDNVVRTLKVAANSPADLSGLANGNWYALVRGIDSIGLEGFNTVKLIAIKDAPPAGPTDPIDPWQPGSNRLISLSAELGQTRINWTALPGDPAVKSYVALIGPDAASLRPVSGSESTSRNLTLGTLQPGTYFIRLRTLLASGQTSDSALYRFELTANWGQTVFGVLSALQTAN